MLHNLLLQLLIAIVPIGAFQIWYSRPGQLGQVPFFLGTINAISMILGMCYAMQYDSVTFDLSFVSYLNGSLYGGIPTAIVLSLIFIVAQLQQSHDPASYLELLVFCLIFIPILLKSIILFQGASRNRKIKIAFRFNVALLLAFVVTISHAYMKHMVVHPHTPFLAITYAIAFVACSILSVHFIELGLDRVQLQMQYREISIKYRSEMRRLQQFIDMVPLSVIFIDKGGMVSHANFSAQKMMYQESAVLLGRHYLDIEREWDVEPSRSPIARVMNGEELVSEVMKVRDRLLYVTACRFTEAWNQKVEGVLFLGHDMTELQQLKDEIGKMERLSLVGQMAAGITHEIRNPMAVIRGFVQLLHERSPQEQQSYFRIILEELDRANNIINDFLSLAQTRTVEKELSQLDEVLEDMLPLIWADANMRGQTVELELDENSAKLELNVKEIKQLVLNLARNGMEAMNDKGILRIETLNQEDRIELRVSDNGSGIPPEKVERLFEPFFTTKAQGTGLGLSLCLSIAERHNGKIEVESVIDSGTTFVVTFCKPGFACW